MIESLRARWDPNVGQRAGECSHARPFPYYFRFVDWLAGWPHGTARTLKDFRVRLDGPQVETSTPLRNATAQKKASTRQVTGLQRRGSFMRSSSPLTLAIEAVRPEGSGLCHRLRNKSVTCDSIAGRPARPKQHSRACSWGLFSTTRSEHERCLTVARSPRTSTCILSGKRMLAC